MPYVAARAGVSVARTKGQKKPMLAPGRGWNSSRKKRPMKAQRPATYVCMGRFAVGVAAPERANAFFFQASLCLPVVTRLQ